MLAGNRSDIGAVQLWDTSVRRSLLRERARGFRRRLNDAMRTLPARTPSGLSLGNVSGVMELEVDRIRRVLEKIVRGLYYHHTGTVLEGVSFKWDELTSPRAVRGELIVRPPTEGDKKLISLLKPLRATRITDDVIYRHGILREDPRHSLWGIRLYRRLFVIATTPLSQETQSG